MRRRWQSWSESEKIAAQIIALAVLGFLYFAWPTPYFEGYKVLPQRPFDSDVATIAKYRVQVNRFTGTMWADTVDGWRRFDSRPLPESELALKEGGNEWYDPKYDPTP
jgi:hypothetical protein